MHIKELQKELPKGKILVVTLVFTAALITIAASMIKKTYEEDSKKSSSELSKSQLRSYLVKSGMTARNELEQNPDKAIKTILRTYAKYRSLTWQSEEIAKPIEYNSSLEFQVNSDTITISFLERNKQKLMKVEAVCGKQCACVIIGKKGLIESTVYKIS